MEKQTRQQQPCHQAPEKLSNSSRKQKTLSIVDKDKSKKLKQDQECIEDLLAERTTLQKLVSQKQETLRQLRLVKLYRAKNNLPELQILIDKWREACQQSLTELHMQMPTPKPSINDLIQLWHLDANLLQYKKDEDSFQ
ncbi:swi5-dependent recombination DNA repair protein 1 homolog [Antedon mediterranea]|uniref:swi5-dependent recombination DNA repair protein 1 homolog n=1 Tax=Antedon mediterranea TaxID=105859 RepID=UPI003AF7B7FE